MKSTLTAFFLLTALFGFSQSSPQLTQAWDAYNAQKFEQCLALLEEARGAEALFLEGNCHQKLGDLHAALQCYDSAESSGCTHENLHLNRGICRLFLGMLDPAEQDLKRQLRDDPQNERALYFMAQLNYERYESTASMDYLERCLVVNPDNTDALFLQGGNYVDNDQWELAANAFQEVLSIDPEHGPAQKALAQVLLFQNDPTFALEILEELQPQTDAERAEVAFFQAEAHYLLHHNEQACKLWTLSAELGDKDAQRNLTNICEKGKEKLRRKRLTRMEL